MGTEALAGSMAQMPGAQVTVHQLRLVPPLRPHTGLFQPHRVYPAIIAQRVDIGSHYESRSQSSEATCGQRREFRQPCLRHALPSGIDVAVTLTVDGAQHWRVGVLAVGDSVACWTELGIDQYLLHRLLVSKA